MLSEDDVTFAIMRWLQVQGWTIVQYHPPGGQASISVVVGNRRVVPDIVAVRDSVILICENKGRQSAEDISKLLEMKRDLDAMVHLRSIVENRLRQEGSLSTSRNWGIELAHGYSEDFRDAGHQELTYLLVASDKTCIRIIGNRSLE